MIFSETNSKIAPALVKAWGEIENPKHNTSVTVKLRDNKGQYKFDYTDLNGIFDEAKRVFKANGISIIQNAYTVISEGKKMVTVETMLLHSSGEYVKSYPLQFEANANIQDMGGQITYMKRYSVSAMLGISTEKDDDANGSMGNEVKFNDEPKASDKQLGFINKLISDNAKLYSKTNEFIYSKTKEDLQIKNELENLTNNEAKKVINHLQEALKKKSA